VKKIFFAAIVFCFSAFWAFAQNHFVDGRDFFMQNRPAEAAGHLEMAVAQDPANVTAFLYLGIVYEQLGFLDEAATVYRQVVDRAGAMTANVANNLGNVMFRRGFMEEAEEFFGQAISADRTFASAHLGRANSRLNQGNLQGAVSDYEQYLLFAPNSLQRPQVLTLIALARQEFAEAERQRAEEELAAQLAAIQAERQRLAAEEAARLAAIEAERMRVAAEEAARLEAERRQQLLDEIAASLAAAEGGQGLGVGAEGMENIEGEFELE